jgi:hypothetical protein
MAAAKAADTQLGSRCEPAAGWHIEEWPGVGLTPVPITHRWCGGTPSVPFEGMLITALQVAETFAAYHRERNGTADRRGAPPVGMAPRRRAGKRWEQWRTRSPCRRQGPNVG